MRIAVAGGTGVVGRHVVQALRADGHEPVVLTRSTGVDLTTGNGLAAVLDGVAAVVDVTSTSSSTAKGATRFFSAVTTNLLAAERTAGVDHHVALSIVGASRVNAGLYAGKKAQEDLVMAAPVGWSLLRATQFHELAQVVAARSRVGPLTVVPTWMTQPVAASEVGAALAQIATGVPRGLDVDLAGPEVERMSSMVQRYLAAAGQRRDVVQVALPGAFGRALRRGSLLPDSDARLGTQTFDDWLGELVAT
jgi:uncharacterized protein YbjT (DUF2867 family)